MQKTVKIKDRLFKLSVTGYTLCIYKQQFNTEYYDDFLRITEQNKTENIEETTKTTLEVYYRLIWSMLKTSDPSISDPEFYISEFDEFPLFELIKVAIELLDKSFSNIKKSENNENGDKLTSENLVACCLSCGMSMNDINTLSISFLLNSISEYIKIQTGTGEKKKTRKATQEDFDRF